MTCDAATMLPTVMDGEPGAACAACEMAHCAAELAACAADCDCDPDEACLGMYMQNFSSCPEAINATMGGNVPLMKVTACIASNCLSLCFRTSDNSGGDAASE